MAPEIIRQNENSTIDAKFRNQDEFYGEKVDIWALGVMAYYLYAGTTPFEDEFSPTLERLHDNILHLEPLYKNIPNEAENFIATCLIKD